MAKLDDLYPSNYLKAGDCEDADLILTIHAVKVESVGMGKSAETKPVLYFTEEDKGLVCNKTNAKAIAKLYGDDTDDWIGKRIALYATEVEYQGETMLGIRVRLKAPKASKQGVPLSTTSAKAEPAPAAATADGEGDGDEEIPF